MICRHTHLCRGISPLWGRSQNLTNICIIQGNLCHVFIHCIWYKMSTTAPTNDKWILQLWNMQCFHMLFTHDGLLVAELLCLSTCRHECWYVGVFQELKTSYLKILCRHINVQDLWNVVSDYNEQTPMTMTRSLQTNHQNSRRTLGLWNPPKTFGCNTKAGNCWHRQFAIRNSMVCWHCWSQLLRHAHFTPSSFAAPGFTWF